MSQLIRVCSEESKKRADKGRGRRRNGSSKEERDGETAVNFNDRRMCIPGDNRVMSWDYSVQMRKRQTHCERQEQHFRHSP